MVVRNFNNKDKKKKKLNFFLNSEKKFFWNQKRFSNFNLIFFLWLKMFYYKVVFKHFLQCVKTIWWRSPVYFHKNLFYFLWSSVIKTNNIMGLRGHTPKKLFQNDHGEIFFYFNSMKTAALFYTLSNRYVNNVNLLPLYTHLANLLWNSFLLYFTSELSIIINMSACNTLMPTVCR